MVCWSVGNDRMGAEARQGNPIMDDQRRRTSSRVSPTIATGRISRLALIHHCRRARGSSGSI